MNRSHALALLVSALCLVLTVAVVHAAIKLRTALEHAGIDARTIFGCLLGVYLAQALLYWAIHKIWRALATHPETDCAVAARAWERLQATGHGGLTPPTAFQRIYRQRRDQSFPSIHADWLWLGDICIAPAAVLGGFAPHTLAPLMVLPLGLGLVAVAIHWIGHVQAARCAPLGEAQLWPPGVTRFPDLFHANHSPVVIGETSLAIVPRMASRWLSAAFWKGRATFGMETSDYARVPLLEGLLLEQLAAGSRVLVLVNETDAVVIVEEPTRDTGTRPVTWAIACVWASELFDLDTSSADSMAPPIISTGAVPRALVECAARELTRKKSRWRTRSPIDSLVAAAAAAAEPPRRGAYR